MVTQQHKLCVHVYCKVSEVKKHLHGYRLLQTYI